MSLTRLTFRSVRVRSVIVPLERPIVSKVGVYHEWPLILIDLQTEEGIVGRSYLQPHLKKAVRYIVPAIEDLAYNSNGLWLSEISTLAEQATQLVEQGGFTALKLRLGRERLDDDFLALDVVRKAVGPEVKIMVDFNQGLTLGNALRWCHALDDQGLCWFEEPIAYNDLDGYAQLARELTTPVQLGENFYGPKELSRAIKMSACDYVMPDLMRIGGVSDWLRSVPVAAAAGIEVSSHIYPETSAHLLRVTETAHWLEWVNWAEPILVEPFEISGGELKIPNKPGIGIEWNEQAVTRYQLKE